MVGVIIIIVLMVWSFIGGYLVKEAEQERYYKRRKK